MRKLRPALFSCGAISLLLAVACASEPLAGHDDAARPAPVPASEYAGRLAETVCGAISTCCGARDLPIDGEACVQEYSGAYAEELEAALALAVRYDADAAAECLESFVVKLSSCRSLGNELATPPCDAVFAGLRAPGESCVGDIECDQREPGPSFCETGADPEMGVCAPRPTQGETCLRPDCVAGLYCDLFTASCQPRQTSGECPLVTVCAEDYACSPDAECVPKLDDGEPCQLDFQCSGGVCDLDSRCARTLASDLVCRESEL